MKSFNHTSKSLICGLFAALFALLSISAAPGLSNDGSKDVDNTSSGYANLTLSSNPSVADGSPKTNLALDMNSAKATAAVPVNPPGLLGNVMLKAAPEPASFVLGVCVLALIAVLSARARSGRSVD